MLRNLWPLDHTFGTTAVVYAAHHSFTEWSSTGYNSKIATMLSINTFAIKMNSCVSFHAFCRHFCCPLKKAFCGLNFLFINSISTFFGEPVMYNLANFFVDILKQFYSINSRPCLQYNHNSNNNVWSPDFPLRPWTRKSSTSIPSLVQHEARQSNYEHA